MPNYRRNRVEGGTYFFTLVTWRRRPILNSLQARTALREALDAVREKRPFEINAFVLLPDHLHCIWTMPQSDSDFSTRWNRIKARFTERYLALGGAESSVSTSRSVRGERGVWQRRFFEHTVRDEADMKRCVDYLHLNPVKHRLTPRVRDWPWSSFHRYVHAGEYDINWGGSTAFLGMSGRDLNRVRLEGSVRGGAISLRCIAPYGLTRRKNAST